MINLLTGELTIHKEDFRIEGPIPLVWRRNYFSQIDRRTFIGEGWHCNYEQTLRIDVRADSFHWTNDNGNVLELPYLEVGDEAVITSEKIRYRHLEGSVEIEDYVGHQTYCYTKRGSDLCCLSAIRYYRFSIQFFL